MKRHPLTGRDATEQEILEAERVLRLTPFQQRGHPSAVKADPSKLSHVHTYGSLPEYYLDQQWYYEVAKGHIEARAVHCHACRTAKRSGAS